MDCEGCHQLSCSSCSICGSEEPLIQCDICGDDIEDGDIAYLIEGQVYCSHCIEDFEFFANSRKSPEESHYRWQEYRKEQARNREEERRGTINNQNKQN